MRNIGRKKNCLSSELASCCNFRTGTSPGRKKAGGSFASEIHPDMNTDGRCEKGRAKLKLRLMVGCGGTTPGEGGAGGGRESTLSAPENGDTRKVLYGLK